MFKTGDKLRYIYKDHISEPLTIGNIYFVIAVDSYGNPKVSNDEGFGWWSNYNNFELYKPKKKPITETDYLDAFKENFKEGV